MGWLSECVRQSAGVGQFQRYGQGQRWQKDTQKHTNHFPSPNEGVAQSNAYPKRDETPATPHRQSRSGARLWWLAGAVALGRRFRVRRGLTC